MQTIVALSGNGTRLFIGRLHGHNISQARGFVYDYDTQTQVGAEIINDAADVNMFRKGVYFNTAGDWLITSSYDYYEQRGTVEMRTFASSSWPTLSNSFSGSNDDRLGSALAISGNGLYAFASAIRTNDTGNYVRVYKRTGNLFAFLTNITATVNLQQWGKSISASADGSTLIVSANNALIYIYKRNTGETYTLFNTIGTTANFTNYNYFNSISINKTGDAIFSTNIEKTSPAQSLPVTIYNWTNNNNVNITATNISGTHMSISGNLEPLYATNTSNLGSTTKLWSNAYIKDLSVANISVSGNIESLQITTLIGRIAALENKIGWTGIIQFIDTGTSNYNVEIIIRRGGNNFAQTLQHASGTYPTNSQLSVTTAVDFNETFLYISVYVAPPITIAQATITFITGPIFLGLEYAGFYTYRKYKIPFNTGPVLLYRFITTE